MKVSVVTAVYNGECYLDRAAPSILAQTYKDFEWVIVDDGSSDETVPRLLELFPDERIRLLRPGRVGFVRALNHGIEAARGDLIARQDFDDVSAPERLERQVGYMEQHPEVGVVGGHFTIVDDTRGERYIRKCPLDHGALIRAMAKGVPFAHTLTTFRRCAWEQAGGYPEMDDIEDLRLWTIMARQGWRLGCVDDVLGEHWVHPESFWHRTYAYRTRQQKLAKVQWQAVRELRMPAWMAVYPLGRYVYAYLPSGAKRVVRRRLAGAEEADAG